MNLLQTVELYGGGPGSGCNPDVGKCGRPKGGSSKQVSKTVSPSERNDPAFNHVLDQLKSDTTLTVFERENIVPLARAYTMAAQSLENGDSTEVHSGPYGGYTKERAGWHDKVISAYESKFGPPQPKPIAIITGGLSGAGKTAGIRNVPGIDRFIHISSDDIKEAAPEYNGANAAFLHEESDQVSLAVLEKASAAKQHLVVDITMSELGDSSQGFRDSILGRVNELSRRGYEVHLMFSDVTIEKSVERALKRYMNPAKGRFVPPSYIKKHVSSKGSTSINFDNFMEATKLPQVTGWKLFDTMGDSPRLVHQGGRGFHVR